MVFTRSHTRRNTHTHLGHGVLDGRSRQQQPVSALKLQQDFPPNAGRTEAMSEGAQAPLKTQAQTLLPCIFEYKLKKEKSFSLVYCFFPPSIPMEYDRNVFSPPVLVHQCSMPLLKL